MTEGLHAVPCAFWKYAVPLSQINFTHLGILNKFYTSPFIKGRISWLWGKSIQEQVELLFRVEKSQNV
jgi:hypothetical protein